MSFLETTVSGGALVLRALALSGLVWGVALLAGRWVDRRAARRAAALRHPACRAYIADRPGHIRRAR